MTMKSRTFNDYEKACKFRDKVNGQTEWCSYKSVEYWIVWYESEHEHGCNENDTHGTYT